MDLAVIQWVQTLLFVDRFMDRSTRENGCDEPQQRRSEAFMQVEASERRARHF